MGSSAKTGKNYFRGSLEHFLDKNAIWDRTPPHLHINCSIHVWERVQESEIFKQNSIILIRSKVMAFLVISLSLWCPRCPHCPCHPHVIPIAPRRTHVVPMAVVSVVSIVSVVSTPCCPRGPRGPHRPHVVPVISTSSPCHPRCPHIVPIAPMWSPCGPHGCGLRCLCGLHPMLSPLSL